MKFGLNATEMEIYFSVQVKRNQTLLYYVFYLITIHIKICIVTAIYEQKKQMKGNKINT